MKLVFAIVLLFALAVVSTGQDIEVATKDGKVVILKPDGTWIFKPVTVILPSALPIKSSEKVHNPLSSFDSQLPFDDLGATEIPARFVGHYSGTIVKILKERFKGKDEFETSAQYATRISTGKTQGLYDYLPLDAVLADVQWDNYSTLLYNADTETLSGAVYTLGTHFKLPSGSGDTRFSFQLKPDAARDLKSNLGVVFLFRIREPYFHTDIVDVSSIAANLVEVWLFNSKTGKVEHKITALDRNR